MRIPKIKEPAESVVLDFDFSSEMAAVSSATVSVEVIGFITDASPAAVLDGAPQMSGAHVFQRMSGGVPGADYKFKCQGVNGQDVIVRAGVVSVRRA